MSQIILQRQIGDQPFSDFPENSYTLPARFYQNPDIYVLEQKAIFFRSWWYAGHASQLAEPGDYLTTQLHDQSVFVVRHADGNLRAFHNVCQHRGHELVKGSGNARTIVCPYHAWAYDHEGQLTGARNTRGMAGFTKCDFSLKPVQVEIFCGLVMINLDLDADSIRNQAPELEREIRSYCPSVDELVYAQRDTYQVNCNWKVMVDNFLECYHCHPAHRDFVDLVDMKNYKSTAKGIYSSHISKAARSTNNAAYAFEKGEVDFGYAGWYLWPNLTLWAYPGEPNLSVLQMIPAGPEQTIEYQDWFIPQNTPSAQLKAAMDYQKDVLQPEDIGLCESVQRGLHSLGYNQGRFVIDAELSYLSEHTVHHFQQLVVDALGAELK